MNRLLAALLTTGVGMQSSLWADVAGGGAQSPTVPSTGGGYLLQLAGGLAVILVVIAVLAWLARRLQALPARQAGAIRVLAALSLGQRERVVLMQVGTTQVLVGVAPGQVCGLHVFAEPAVSDQDQSAAGAAGFAALFTALKATKP